jgi:neutral trehalase
MGQCERRVVPPSVAFAYPQYFMALGLLVDGKMDLVKSIVEHCIFEIKHYNKVLNGNRSYVGYHHILLS